MEWKRDKRCSPQILSGSLAAASAPLPENEVRELVAQASECRVRGIGIQALGLIGWAYPGIRPFPRGLLKALCAGIPEACWHLRMDVISVAEALTWSGAEAEAVP